jgi:hypothetical protein
MTAWRDMDSSSHRVGFILRRDGVCIYVAKRLYRIRWRTT